MGQDQHTLGAKLQDRGASIQGGKAVLHWLDTPWTVVTWFSLQPLIGLMPKGCRYAAVTYLHHARLCICIRLLSEDTVHQTNNCAG
jgi:hypothetical protein